MLLHTQLSRILKSLPDQAPKPKVEPDRTVHFGFRTDGWWEGHQVLPPDEGALAQRALESSRHELFHDRADGDGSARIHLGPLLPDRLRRTPRPAARAKSAVPRRGRP